MEGYGLTEAGPVTHGTPLHGLRKAGSIGIPLPSTEARVVSLHDRTQEVAVGEIGELAVRGPQIMAGYWRDSGGHCRGVGWGRLVADGRHCPDGQRRLFSSARAQSRDVVPQ